MNQEKPKKPEAKFSTFSRINKMSHAELALVFERQSRKITNQRKALRQLNKKLDAVVKSARAQEFGKTSVAEMSHELKKALQRLREAQDLNEILVRKTVRQHEDETSTETLVGSKAAE